MQRKLAQAAVFQLRAQLLRNIVCAVTCLGLFTLSAASQLTSPAAQDSSSAQPSFEVVSIKPDHSGWGGMSSDHPPFGPHYSATNVTTKALIEMAYDLKDFQLDGAPSWISSQRYDVEANIGATTLAQIRGLSHDGQYDQLKLLIQSLLADRFNLRVVRALKEFSGYNLVLSKDDSKLRSLAVNPFPGNTKGTIIISNRGNGEWSLEPSKANFEIIAGGLSRALGLPVIDKTGVKGNYTFAIRWTNDAQTTGGSPPEPAYDRTVTAALADAGLKLIHTKVPTDTITIVHIEEPSPN